MTKRKVKKVVIRENYSAKMQNTHISNAKYRIIGIDPGKTNMGICCLGVDLNDNVIIFANAVMTSPLNQLSAGFMQSMNTFMAEIDLWVKTYSPQCLAIERFMTRGIKGDSIECVSGMWGAISYKYQLPTKLLNAAVWKNAFRRKFPDCELDSIYNYSKTTPHAIDAILQACYALELALQRPIHYSPESIIEMAEATSLTKLINRQSRI
jgi:hypothetical protein